MPNARARLRGLGLTAKLGTATDTYAYPLTSNRLSMINLATGGTRGFTYDLAGNVTTEARAGGAYSYTYNAAGRMSEFKINGVLQASYKYDAMGRQAIRTLSTPTAVTIHSVFDSDGRRIAEYNETSGALIREYVWHGWDPIAVIEGGTISFVRADHIGRPVFATNATGVKTWTATYTPFGGVHTSTGAPPSARFPGQWFQSESGLHQNWMRDYDPTTGRYLQADPLGLVDGASVYGYAGQSPMMNIDPSGQCVGPAVVWCARAAWFAFFLIVDILSDEDGCYTWEDFGWFVTYYAIPGRAGAGIRFGSRFGDDGGHGGGPKANRGDGPPPKSADPTPSPALKDSPYHPNAVRDRVHPQYNPNPAHDPRSPKYNPHKTPEPPDAASAYGSARRYGNSWTWYAKGEGGWYRYFSDNAGGAHFSGIETDVSVIRELMKGL